MRLTQMEMKSGSDEDGSIVSCLSSNAVLTKMIGTAMLKSCVVCLVIGLTLATKKLAAKREGGEGSDAAKRGDGNLKIEEINNRQNKNDMSNNGNINCVTPMGVSHLTPPTDHSTAEPSAEVDQQDIHLQIIILIIMN